MRDNKDYDIKSFWDVVKRFGILVVVTFLGIVLPISLGFVEPPYYYKGEGYVLKVVDDVKLPRVYFLHKNATQPQRLCVDEGLVAELKKALEEKKLVKIEYGRGWFMPVWRCGLFEQKINIVLVGTSN